MNNLKLEITSKAYKDIEIIADYIAKDNKNAAVKFVKLFNKTFEILCLNPCLGKIVCIKGFIHLSRCLFCTIILYVTNF